MKIRIRTSLISLITVLIAVTGIILIIIFYVNSRGSMHYYADKMLREVSATVSQKIIGYLGSAPRSNRMTRYLIENNKLDYRNIEELLAYFREELKTNPEFLMYYFADTSGNMLLLKRQGKEGRESFSKRNVTRTGQDVITKWRHEDESFRKTFPDTKEDLVNGYDPRARVWYKNALGKKDVSWSEIYFFASDKQLGISNSAAIYNENNLIGVVSIDIGIIEFSYFLNHIKPTPNTKVFIKNNKNEIIALPIKDKTDASILFKKPKEPSGTAIYELHRIEDYEDETIRESDRNRGRTSEPFYFSSGGETYISMYAPLPDDHGLSLEIGIVIPEKDLMGTVYRNIIITIAASLMLIVITLLLGAVFSKTITEPLNLLSLEMSKIANFDMTSNEEQKISTIIREIEDMKISFSSMKNGLRSFSKYVPSDLVAQLINNNKEAVIEGENRELTMFFSDIKGFTTISEQLSPGKLVESLGEYFSVTSKTIVNSNGTVDKYIGDGIMAFWNAPKLIQDHPLHACFAALDCQKKLEELFNTTWKKKSIPPFITRIGIHTGYVVVGNMGYEERFNYTVLGDNANLTSRLEGINKLYGTLIIISESTYNYVSNQVIARLLDKVAVKGKHNGIKIYELISSRKKGDLRNAFRNRLKNDSDIDVILALLKKHDTAVKSYFCREWEKSLSLFKELDNEFADDQVIKIYIERLKKFIASPPPEDWDGTFIATEK